MVAVVEMHRHSMAVLTAASKNCPFPPPRQLPRNTTPSSLSSSLLSSPQHPLIDSISSLFLHNNNNSKCRECPFP